MAGYIQERDKPRGKVPTHQVIDLRGHQIFLPSQQTRESLNSCDPAIGIPKATVQAAIGAVPMEMDEARRCHPRSSGAFNTAYSTPLVQLV